nr:hypothetical protein [Pseudoclavibacter chungangensis]
MAVGQRLAQIPLRLATRGAVEPARSRLARDRHERVFVGRAVVVVGDALAAVTDDRGVTRADEAIAQRMQRSGEAVAQRVRFGHPPTHRLCRRARGDGRFARGLEHRDSDALGITEVGQCVVAVAADTDGSAIVVDADLTSATCHGGRVEELFGAGAAPCDGGRKCVEGSQ